MSSWNETEWFAVFCGAALKSTAVLAAAWIASRLLRGSSAAARHLVWTAAVAAVLLLPWFSVALPELTVPVRMLPASVWFQVTATAQPAAAAPAGPSSLTASGRVAPGARRTNWRALVLLLWAAGAVIALLQVLVSWMAVRRMRHTARPFANHELPAGLARALGIRRPVEVLETAAAQMPMTFGLVRSAVFLPSGAAAWSEERRRVVLLHELAHVRRGDAATHLLARMALALYWWNPLAWVAFREFLKERERAADDLVLSAGARASDYAGHLLEVARTLRCSPSLACSAACMARPSQLEGRLLAILDPRTDRRSVGWASALITALLAAAIAVPIAAVHAQDPAAQAPPETRFRTSNSAQDPAAQAVTADVDATIRAAMSQKNHEMLEQAASSFANLRQYDTAQKLLESALTIRGQVAGEQSVEYGLGLLKLGELEERRNRKESAKDFYTRAAQVLGDRPQASAALLHLGINALGARDLEKAAEYFQHAQSVDPSAAGRATMWLAIVRERQQQLDQAEILFQSALALQDQKPNEQAITMRLYATLMKSQDRTDEAMAMNDRAAAVQKTAGARAFKKSSSSANVYHVGGSVMAPKVLSKVDPEYSEEARAAKYQGTVLLYVEIWPDGLAHNAQVIQGLGMGLDDNASTAISQWRFQPGTRDGQPVNVAATIEVNFRLL
jgi:TonB family protein